MFEYRVTKYDPSHRDERGGYTRDEWTSFGDIGRTLADGLFTGIEYQRVEDAYVASALAFMREAGIESFKVSGLENSAATPLSFGDGASLSVSEVATSVRRILREEFWCRLEAVEGFIHFGWDYYMYIGVWRPCPAAVALAQQMRLFVEPFESPYKT